MIKRQFEKFISTPLHNTEHLIKLNETRKMENTWRDMEIRNYAIKFHRNMRYIENIKPSYVGKRGRGGGGKIRN